MFSIMTLRRLIQWPLYTILIFEKTSQAIAPVVRKNVVAAGKECMRTMVYPVVDHSI